MSARMPISLNPLARDESHPVQAVAQQYSSPRQPRLAQAAVRVSIERLGIEGVNLTSRQGAQMQGAVERELARLLQAQPLALRADAIAGLRAPPLSSILGADPDPDALGMEIAHKLFAAIRTTERDE